MGAQMNPGAMQPPGTGTAAADGGHRRHGAEPLTPQIAMSGAQQPAQMFPQPQGQGDQNPSAASPSTSTAMYHPDLIAEDAALCAHNFRAVFEGELPWYSTDDSEALTAQIMQAYDDDGETARRAAHARRSSASSARRSCG